MAGLVARRREPRTDPVRAGFVLWGTWLVVLGVAFSASATINAYYLAALAPAVAALIAMGSTLAWDLRRRVAARVAVMAAVLFTAGYAAWLLPASGTGMPGWLAPTVLGLGVLGCVAWGTTLVIRGAHGYVAGSMVVALAAMVLVPTVASVSVVTNTLGPFDTPFQSTATTRFTRSFFSAPFEALSALPRLEAVRNGAPDLMATQTSVLASTFIFATGQEVLPIGGYTGTIPSPSVASLASMVASGTFHVALGARSRDPRMVWIARHCLKVPAPPSAPGSGLIVPIRVYFCVPPR
jgi:4-amino-4-deoxy-L-arabinose transferase-like glycosyltransferase